MFNAEVINFFPKYRSHLKILDAQMAICSNFRNEDLQISGPKVPNLFGRSTRYPGCWFPVLKDAVWIPDFIASYVRINKKREVFGRKRK